MADGKSFWDFIIEFIKRLFGKDLTTPKDPAAATTTILKKPDQSTGDYLKTVTNDALADMKQETRDAIVAETTKLLLNHGKTLMGMTEVQKEYAVHVAMLKSIETFDKLSYIELKEYRDVASKTLELGIQVTVEVNNFWNDFGDAVKKVLGVATEIGARAAATAIKALILI